MKKKCIKCGAKLDDNSVALLCLPCIVAKHKDRLADMRRINAQKECVFESDPIIKTKNAKSIRPNKKTEKPLPVCPNDCLYMSNEMGYQICNYILVEGNGRRGCAAGKDCKRYISCKDRMSEMKKKSFEASSNKAKKKQKRPRTTHAEMTAWHSEAEKLNAQGYVDREIAEKLGKSLQTIKEWRWKNNIHAVGRWSEQRKAHEQDRKMQS